MSFHKQLLMDSACSTEESREAGLGTPSTLLDADRCQFGSVHVLAEALMSESVSPAFFASRACM
jgi:hypothetical protein